MRVCLAGSNFTVHGVHYTNKKLLMQHLRKRYPSIQEKVVFAAKVDLECDFIIYPTDAVPPKSYLKYGTPSMTIDSFLKVIPQYTP